ncbi:zinc finger MYM-type protein 1-like [Procambarus clarkii]|uniref:zinc finger MYM-type protein 1-like n=1 Tax=Procambarus clarkii TaxID=6728 RepID=UPI003743C093
MKHEQSAKHMNSVIDLLMLGKVNSVAQIDSAYMLSVAKHNEEVEKNRNVLSKIINCVKFCGKFDLPLRGHAEATSSKNPGIFRGLVDFACGLDSSLDAHIRNVTVFKGLSKSIQNELLESMLEICKNKIKEEVKNAEYLAVMCDETTDIYDKTQMVIVLRYELQGRPVERFWGFFNLINKTVEALSIVLLKELQILIGDYPHKLIAQTYDGAAVVIGANKGVQTIVKEVYTNAHFIHCYAHQLNLIVEQAALQNTDVRVFFNSVSGIPAFVSKSPQKVAAAAGVKRVVNDPEFEFWLEFFSKVMPHVDILFSQFQSRNIDAAKANASLKAFTSAVHKLRDECDAFVPPPEPKRRKFNTDRLVAAKEVCDVILLQCRARFSFTNHLEASKLLLVNQFPVYTKDFPSTALVQAVAAYPMLEKDKLRTELSVLYTREDLYKSENLIDLLEIMNNNHLQSTFSETVKLLKILITTPMITAEAERCFLTLKRIKAFLRNTMAIERLSALAMISIENIMITEIKDFNEKVINHFATLKSRCTDFLFK